MAAMKRLYPLLSYVPLALVLLAYFTLQHELTGQMKQLPSPIYGGDYYYQAGAVNHVKYGGSPAESSNLVGDAPAYFVLYSLIVGNIARVFDVSAIRAMFYFSDILVVLSLLVTFFALRRVLKDVLAATLGTLLYLPAAAFPVLKYANFTYVLVAPLFFLALFNLFRERSLKNAALLGIAYGLGALSHMIFFVYATFMLAFFSAYALVFEHVGFRNGSLLLEKGGLRKAAPRSIRLLLVAIGIGLLIAMVYWYTPIFRYHLKTLNAVNVWSGPDYSDYSFALGFAAEKIKGLFFNFSDPYALLRLAGLLGVFFLKNRSIETKFLAFALFASALGALHFLVTGPLAGRTFMPDYVYYFGMLNFVAFSMFSLNLLARQKPVAPYRSLLLVLLIGYAAYGSITSFQGNLKNDRWIELGRSEPAPNFLAVADWVPKNTGVNDVFLSSNELGFALNALTGRKLVTSRRAHNSPFVDMDQRNADAAAILYGSNGTLRRELLKKYGVRYLYWDYYWIQSEYSFDKNGRIAGTFDPLLVFDSQRYREYFERNNITYFKMHTWADPAMKADNIPQFDLLFVIPNQWDWEHPWSNGLDPYLTEVWSNEQGGQTISRIYEVRV